jgi:hypothetical protein
MSFLTIQNTLKHISKVLLKYNLKIVGLTLRKITSFLHPLTDGAGLKTSTIVYNKIKQTPWPDSASELHRLSDRHLSAKLVPTFTDRGVLMVSVTNPYGRVLDFLDPSCYFFL